MASIYGRLGYNFTPANTAILEISEGAKSQLNSMPKLLKDWQITDIANSDTGGYYKNPVANSCAALTVNVSAIFSAANNDPVNTWINFAEAITLQNVANNFLIELNTANNSFVSHTNNVSGVNPITTAGEAVNEFPFFDTATALGRMLIFLTHESDGILNSSPIIGSMTSILIDEELQANSTIIYNDFQKINNSFAGNGIYTISSSDINVIISHIQTANNLITTRRDSDYTFYNNVRSVVNDYGQVGRFSNMGEVNRNLVIDYVGTDKIVSRLNSETGNTQYFSN